MSTTDRHGFFLWSAGFTQSDVLLNDLLLKLERKVGLSVVSRTTDAQPGAPAAGDCYIMTAGRTGAAWAGFATNDVAIYRDATWYADAPISGLLAWVEDDAELVAFDGTTYQVVTVANPIGDADFAAAEGFMRKTGAGAYEAIKSNLTATTDPGATDDSAAGYAVGSRWINVTLDKEFVCLDATATAAVWTETTAAGSGLSESQVDARVVAVAPTTATSRAYFFLLSDDSVWSYNFGEEMIAGSVIIMSNQGSPNHNGLFVIRAHTSPICAALVSNNITASTSVLAGTTGVDGAITFSAASDNAIYLENRRGFSVSFSVTVNSHINSD